MLRQNWVVSLFQLGANRFFLPVNCDLVQQNFSYQFVIGLQIRQVKFMHSVQAWKSENKCNIIDWKILRWDFLLSYFLVCMYHANVVFGKKIFKNELFCIRKFRRETLICHLFFSGEKIPKQTITKYSSFRSIGSLPFWTNNR